MRLTAQDMGCRGEHNVRIDGKLSFVNHHFACRGVSKEALRACRSAVCPRHEDRDQIANLRHWQHNLVPEPVERGAQAANNANAFGRFGTEPVGNRKRIVPAHDGSEIA